MLNPRIRWLAINENRFKRRKLFYLIARIKRLKNALALEIQQYPGNAGDCPMFLSLNNSLAQISDPNLTRNVNSYSPS